MQMHTRSGRSRAPRTPGCGPTSTATPTPTPTPPHPPHHGHSPDKVSAPLTIVAGTGPIPRGEETVLVKTEFLRRVKVPHLHRVELQRAM